MFDMFYMAHKLVFTCTKARGIVLYSSNEAWKGEVPCVYLGDIFLELENLWNYKNK